MAEYVYQPLLERQFRLLDILPGTQGVIRCQVRNVPVSTEIQYEALSYCWGQETDKVKILVNGLPFATTRNLHAALLRLRSPDRPRTLWVDAICINQGDIPEKNKQVPLMRDIYKSSRRTIIWLGEHDLHTRSAFQAVEFMASNYGGEKFNYYNWKQMARGELPGEEDSLWKRMRSPPERLRSAAAFNSLFSRPWFTRVWVIQELALSPCATVVCGSFQMDWVLIEEAFNMSRTNFEVQNHLGTMLRFRNWPEDSTDDIFARMTVAWHKDSTDPRDKIYAFMGLVAADISHVFTQFTRTYLSQTSNLQVLAICRGCKPTDPPDLPSWAIDYKFDRNEEPLPDQLISRTYDGWKGSGGGWDAGGTSLHKTVATFDGNLLCLQGFKFDSIASNSMANAPAPARVAASNLANLVGAWMSGVTFCRFYMTAKKMAEDAHPGGVYTPTKQTALEALWNIVYGNDPLNKYENAQAGARKQCQDFDRILTEQTGQTPPQGSKGLAQLARIHLALVVLRGLLGDTPYLQFFGRIGTTKQRRFLVTEKGYMGLGPRDSRVGDHVLVLQGHRAPIVARRRGDRWRTVGESYVHGIMEGEAFDQGKCEILRFE
ncbi:Uu.00g067370.m01.CDS01 [Anthostomella pinea]|uniref:Uu.00g067370.m01.CDS01 n=1 Tax=Anthostomella pinea TaxID=933095 RepID=A0AAI8VU39_9PEZI|nr:Uu.00g067370.m01.CDS01 [Anthostomella pinea]